MSIYGTFFSIEDERQIQAGLRGMGISGGVLTEDGLLESEEDLTEGLTPDMLDAPIKYQGSHILPHESDERSGSISLSCIPSHITREGRHDGPSDERHWPYLRLDVDESFEDDGATVVLTLEQAMRLRDALIYWTEQVQGFRNIGDYSGIDE